MYKSRDRFIDFSRSLLFLCIIIREIILCKKYIKIYFGAYTEKIFHYILSQNLPQILSY